MDADCSGGSDGWATCGIGKCLNTTDFPPDQFPNNTAEHGMKETDNCCLRNCNRNHLCRHMAIGCDLDEDCGTGFPGYFCNKEEAFPRCERRCTTDHPCEQGEVKFRVTVQA